MAVTIRPLDWRSNDPVSNTASVIMDQAASRFCRSTKTLFYFP